MRTKAVITIEDGSKKDPNLVDISIEFFNERGTVVKKLKGDKPSMQLTQAFLDMLSDIVEQEDYDEDEE